MNVENAIDYHWVYGAEHDRASAMRGNNREPSSLPERAGKFCEELWF